MKVGMISRVAAAVAMSAGLCSGASAEVVSIPNPGGSTEIGARVRWGGTGFEAGLYDGGVAQGNLNPTGTPTWQQNVGYGFEVKYTASTGTISLSVDFNRDGSFGTGESISQSVFVSPGLTSYAGYGFKYLQISGNEGGSTARSHISNLMINATSIANLTPSGTFLDTFYDDNAGIGTPWAITGTLTYLTAGTATERPSWNFNFRGADLIPVTQAVSEPATIALMGLALLGSGLGALRRRQVATS